MTDWHRTRSHLPLLPWQQRRQRPMIDAYPPGMLSGITGNIMSAIRSLGHPDWHWGCGDTMTADRARNTISNIFLKQAWTDNNSSILLVDLPQWCQTTMYHLTTLSSDYYYQLFAGLDLVPYQHLPHKLLLLQSIQEYARGSQNICLA
jgi:hypothetical protein